MKLKSIMLAARGRKLENATKSPNIEKDYHYWTNLAKENIYSVRSNPDFWSDDDILKEAEMRVNIYLLPFILGNGTPPKEANVLEIGCGIGRLGYHIAPLVHSYTGIDFCEEYLDKAKSFLHNYENCTLISNDGVTLKDIEDESQDLVFCLRVLVHAQDSKTIYSYIQETIRVLKKDGIAKLEIRGVNAMSGHKLQWVNLDYVLRNRRRGNYFKRCVKRLLGYFPGDLQIPIRANYEKGGIYGEGIPYKRAIEFVSNLGAFAAVAPFQPHSAKVYSSNLSTSYWLYIYKDENRKVIIA